MKRTLSLVALAIVAALIVAGCGSGNSSTTASGGSFNDADVTFARSMIPHHRQAVEMAKLAQRRASAPQVKRLAAKIEGAQGPEIDTMTGWLTSWGNKVPSGSMSGMGHSRGGMPGMMSAADMKNLGGATGPKFDRLFLTMMMSHHSGAIEMAKTEQKDGKDPDAVTLAKKIKADQTAEITDMKKLS